MRTSHARIPYLLVAVFALLGLALAACAETEPIVETTVAPPQATTGILGGVEIDVHQAVG